MLCSIWKKNENSLVGEGACTGCEFGEALAIDMQTALIL